MNDGNAAIVLEALRSTPAPATLGSIVKRYEDLLRVDYPDRKPITKESVHYHLGEWIKKEMVKNEGHLYKIDVDQKYLHEILRALRSPKTLYELEMDLRNPKNSKEFPLLSKLLGRKEEDVPVYRTGRPIERSDLLQGFVEFLLAREQVQYIKNEKPNKIMITPKGCVELKVCYHCKDHFNDGPAIAHGLEAGLLGLMEGRGDKWSESPSGHSTLSIVLLHPRCFKDAMNKIFQDDNYDDVYKIEDCCDFCGLPLSSAALRKLLHRRALASSLVNLLGLDTHLQREPGHSWPSTRERLETIIEGIVNNVLNNKTKGTTDPIILEAVKYAAKKVENEEERIEHIVARVFGDPIHEAYELVDPPVPGVNVTDDNFAFTGTEIFDRGYRSIGLSLVYTTAEGRYHIPCYTKLEMSRRPARKTRSKKQPSVPS